MRSSVGRLEKTYSEQLDFHVLNIDHLSTRDLTTKYHIVGIPMIVLLDAQGDVFRTLFGFQTEEQLIAAVEALLADHAGG
jgi:thioredoxin-related protein